MDNKNPQNQNGQNKNNREPQTKDLKREGGKENAMNHKERDMTGRQAGRMEHQNEHKGAKVTDSDEDMNNAPESRTGAKDAVSARA